MMHVDCRNKSEVEAARSVVDHYDALAPGDRAEAVLLHYPKQTRMWLLEAGVRHAVTRDPDGAWRLAFARGLSPALGTATGFHHLVARDDGTIWACQRSPVVARIDGGTRRVAVVAPVLKSGSHLAIDDSGDQIVVADPAAGQLVALRQSDLSVAHRWAVPDGPQLPLVTADGVICVTGAATGTLTIIRPQGGGYAMQTVEVGPTPHDPALSSDGSHAFVPCMGSTELAKVRLADGAIVGRCVVGDGPSHAKADYRRKRIYVANSWDGTLTALDEEGQVIASVASGRWAHALCLTPDGGQIWVANFLDDTIAVFDAVSMKRIALLPTEAYPHGLDISPDGKRAVVTGFAADHTRILDVPSCQLLARVEIGRGGAHTAFIHGSRMAVVTCSVADHLACIDLENGGKVGQITLAA
ncbi:MAG: beta-propeller fold lactonase family protein [Alphaproteobacteria bacterium]|nr:beta-propeller fold lactonase family protein [Alphaproteobacteria bacterium]